MKVPYTVNGRTFLIERPLQARDTELKASSNRGFMPFLKKRHSQIIEILKSHDALEHDYESGLEQDTILLLVHDINCIDVQAQPITLQYEHTNGNFYPYTPDIWAVFIDENTLLIIIFEVKTERDLENLVKDENWHRKVATVRKYCRERSDEVVNGRRIQWKFQVITDRQIKCTRLSNIKNCYAAAK